LFPSPLSILHHCGDSRRSNAGTQKRGDQPVTAFACFSINSTQRFSSVKLRPTIDAFTRGGGSGSHRKQDEKKNRNQPNRRQPSQKQILTGEDILRATLVLSHDLFVPFAPAQRLRNTMNRRRAIGLRMVYETLKCRDNVISLKTTPSSSVRTSSTLYTRE
jgi:hypothetical protein